VECGVSTTRVLLSLWPHLALPTPICHIITLSHYWAQIKIYSGVTRVGVTRCGNWWRHLFSYKKVTTFVSHRHHSHSLPAFPPFQAIVSPVPFVKFSRKIFFFHEGVNHLNGVIRGGQPPCPLVTPLKIDFLVSLKRFY